jgi:enoyl-[acyl-carrier-protein] reductase (NADH)
MEQTIRKLNKTIEAMVPAIEENIAFFLKAATVEEKRKIAEILQFLTASQKNISDVVYTLDNSPYDDFDEDFKDDFDDDDFDDFMNHKKLDFKGKKNKGGKKGKKSSDDDDIPF